MRMVALLVDVPVTLGVVVDLYELLAGLARVTVGVAIAVALEVVAPAVPEVAWYALAPLVPFAPAVAVPGHATLLPCTYTRPPPPPPPGDQFWPPVFALFPPAPPLALTPVQVAPLTNRSITT